ncbi:MAG: glycosyltransferase family 4 protein [Spirochaetes bacterium]|jgi:phosphatidylinositol alpha-1,6-mannosyltransferase|nr:glycosyltransferase family 4 protein [Spirochaetota bacterium]
MEALFITHKYPPSIGGMEKQSYELISGVSKSYKVHTLIYDNNTSKLNFFLSLSSRVKKILKENPGISVIHLNDGLMALFGLFLRKITRVPILVTLHGLDIVFPSKIFQSTVEKHFKKYDGLIAVSRATAEECLKRGFDREKIFVVRNGVDTDLSEIHKKNNYRSILEKKLQISLEGKKILVSVGRSVIRKGFSWFLNKVMPKLDKDVIYIIIGPPQRHIKKIFLFLSLLPERIALQISLVFGLGMDEIYIKKALKKPELKNRAFYLGKQPFEEMVQILKHSDLFIMPNIKVKGDAEGFGLVALEAAICGLPVVASAIEGITCAVIDGGNGFLVPPQNPDSWVSKIHSLLSDMKALKKFGEAAKHYTITNYKWERMVEGYISIFKKFQHRQPLSAKKVWNMEKRDYPEFSESFNWNKFVRKNA